MAAVKIDVPFKREKELYDKMIEDLTKAGITDPKQSDGLQYLLDNTEMTLAEKLVLASQMS